MSDDDLRAFYDELKHLDQESCPEFKHQKPPSQHRRGSLFVLLIIALALFAVWIKSPRPQPDPLERFDQVCEDILTVEPPAPPLSQWNAPSDSFPSF